MNLLVQSSNTDTLCNAVSETANKHCPSLSDKAKKVQDTFKDAFGKFAACHNRYNGNSLTTEQINELGKNGNSTSNSHHLYS